MSRPEDGWAGAIANLIWGVGLGVLFGVILALLGVLILVTKGSEAVGRVGASPRAITAGYLLGGAMAGAVVGLLRPIASRPFGAALVGMVAAVPVSVLFQIILGEATSLTSRAVRGRPVPTTSTTYRPGKARKPRNPLSG